MRRESRRENKKLTKYPEPKKDRKAMEMGSENTTGLGVSGVQHEGENMKRTYPVHV